MVLYGGYGRGKDAIPLHLFYGNHPELKKLLKEQCQLVLELLYKTISAMVTFVIATSLLCLVQEACLGMRLLLLILIGQGKLVKLHTHSL